MLTLIRASKVLTTDTGQHFSVQLAPYTYRETVSGFPAVNTPSPTNQSFVRYVHFLHPFLTLSPLPVFHNNRALFQDEFHPAWLTYRECSWLANLPTGKAYSPPTKDCFNTFAICPEDTTHYIPNTGLCLPCRHKSDSTTEYPKINQFTHGSNTPTGLNLRISSFLDLQPRFATTP